MDIFITAAISDYSNFRIWQKNIQITEILKVVIFGSKLGGQKDGIGHNNLGKFEQTSEMHFRSTLVRRDSQIDSDSPNSDLVTSMLATDVGDQMCWCQVRDVDDRFRMLVTDLI